MKKGFTLIELLAVIVILAIIALIATPIVLNIINDTKQSATLRSADFYLDAVNYAISTSILNGTTIEDGTYSITEDGNICIGTLEDKVCKGEILEVKVNGKKPNGDKITIKDGQIVSHVIKFGDVIVKNEDSSPEKNQYGFYYNVPYVAKIDGFGTVALVFYDDDTFLEFDNVTLANIFKFESAALFISNPSSESSEHFTYDEATRTATPESGAAFTFSEAGKSIVCNGYNFVATGSERGVYYDYEYVNQNGIKLSFVDDGSIEIQNGDDKVNFPINQWGLKQHLAVSDLPFLASIDGSTVIALTGQEAQIFECTFGRQLLATPNVSIDGNVLTISRVENATGYEVYIGDELLTTTTETTVNLVNPKDYTISVRAVGTSEYIASGFAKTYYDLLIPGLYVTGAINLYQTNGTSAIKEMLITPWSELIAEGIVQMPSNGTNGILDESQIAALDGDLIIPDSVVKLNYNQFNGAKNLTGILCLGEITEIGGYAFANCSGLTSFVIPNGVTRIEKSTFRGCSNLTSLTIPNTITYIDEYAFGYCENLTEVTFLGTVENWGAMRKSSYWSRYWNSTGGQIWIHCSDDSTFIFPNNG